MSDKTEELVELGGDIASATTDILEEAYYLTPRHLLVVGVVAGGIGGAVAYFVGKKRLEAKYAALAEQEIAEAKAFYSRLHKKGDLDSPSKVVNNLLVQDPANNTIETASTALREYQGEGNSEEAEEVIVESEVDVFVKSHADPDFDYDEEMKTRSPDHPYIISSEEFMQNEPEHHQTTITYYEGDGALADEQDQEIPIIDKIVGEEHMMHFGHGSGDERVLYVRNEKLATDFEVLKHDGKYAYEVLGLEHSDGGRRGRIQGSQIRKFRGGDE